MNLLFVSIFLAALFNENYSKVIYNNPNNQKVLSVTKGDEFIVSWNLNVNDENYLHSRMILRHKDQSVIICKFDDTNFFIFESIYQGVILDIQRTQIKFMPTAFELDGVIFSIENSYRVSETTNNVEVYDYIPMFVIAKPSISCQNEQKFLNNTLIIECSVRSKPETDINVGFQMMHNGFNTTKETLLDNQGFSITKLVISFPLNVYYFNKLLFVSASVGKYHEIHNVTLTSKLPPFNVKLFVQEDNSPEQNINIYSADTSNMVVKCAADSFTGKIQYIIKAPNKKTFSEEQIIIENFDEKLHSGSWECSAKNDYGTVKSQPIVVNILEEKPSIPMIKINNIINSTNTFCVDHMDVISVSCQVITNKVPLIENNSLNYTLQIINNGSKYNKTTNNHGTFDIVFDESFQDNIYACRAENHIGIGSPAIFYLYKNKIMEYKSINFMKTIEIHSYYKGAMCGLTVLLVACVVILIVKLQHRTNRMILCGSCYGAESVRSNGHRSGSSELSANRPEANNYGPRNMENSFPLEEESAPTEESNNNEEKLSIDDDYATPKIDDNADENAPLL